MKKPADLIAFLLILAGAALFVIRSASMLPEVVATHFGPSGAANGYMARGVYVRFMLIFVVLLPLALNFLVSRVLHLPNTRINIPHREYWLSSERRDDTVERLQRHMRFFAALLTLDGLGIEAVSGTGRPSLPRCRFAP